MDLMYPMYACLSVVLSAPQDVLASRLSKFSLLDAFSAMLFIKLLKVSFLSSWTPKYVGFSSRFIWAPSRVNFSFVFFSLLLRVKIVYVVLLVLIFSFQKLQ